MSTAYLTLRDLDLLSALERCPLTVRAFKALSVTFHRSFGSERRLQDRLAILTHAGLLRRFRYATFEGAGQHYYTLSPEGSRLLHDKDTPLPSPGLFREVGIARQHHTQRLAEFIVHTAVAAHEAGIELTNFARENTRQLSVGAVHLYPDCAFSLQLAGREPFTFYVELDNSSEPLTSPRERESWQRKLHFYEALQDQSPGRFRVLALITKSPQRIRNVLALAGSLAKNRHRGLVYGIYLPEYLQHPTPLFAALFSDHRGQSVGLLPRPDDPVQGMSPSLPQPLAQAATVC